MLRLCVDIFIIIIIAFHYNYIVIIILSILLRGQKYMDLYDLKCMLTASLSHIQ